MIRLRLKNRPYGFIYEDALPKGPFTKIKIPVDDKNVAITSEYNELANNHCACVCTMNIALILKKFNTGDFKYVDLGNDAVKIFSDIHKIVGNGPVFLYKPKLNRFLRSKGSGIRAVPVKKLETIEDSIKSNVPVAMLVNYGITKWHWVLVIGIRKYADGSIYLNILDGWNKRSDRYMLYEGRKSFIRALKPTWE